MTTEEIERLRFEERTFKPYDDADMFRAYTIGSTKEYDRSLREEPVVTKVGRQAVGDPNYPEGYEGGWVWKSVSEAREFINTHKDDRYSIYELRLSGTWSECVSGIFLVKDARVLRKVSIE